MTYMQARLVASHELLRAEVDRQGPSTRLVDTASGGMESSATLEALWVELRAMQGEEKSLQANLTCLADQVLADGSPPYTA